MKKYCLCIQQLGRKAAEIVSSIYFACAGNPRGRRPKGSIALLPFGNPIAFALRRKTPEIFFFLLFLPQFILALGWQDLWYTPDQQAQKLFMQGKMGDAANKFNDSSWKGAAFYRSQQYQRALQEFEKSNTPLANYNRGNALAHLGQLHEAIHAYDQALKQDPKFADALYNKKLIEEALKQQPPKQNQQNNSNQQNNNQGQDNNKDKQNQQQNHANGADNQSQNQQQNQGNPPQQNAAHNQSQNHSSDQNNKPSQQPSSTQQSSSSPKQPSAANAPQQTPDQTQQAQNSQNQSSPQQNPSPSSAKSNENDRKAAKQWMQQIPDDPGGLLRQKFLRDHLRLQGVNTQ